MSSHSNNSRPFGGSRGRFRNQQQPQQQSQRFVPKAKPQTPPTVTGEGDGVSSTGSRQKCGPNYTTPRLSSSLRSRSLAFVNYLPQDEALASGLAADLDTLDSQTAVDLLNDQLSSLLRLSPREFWKEVAGNDDLLEALDSYLLFRNRWYDLPHRWASGTIAGIVVGDGDLSRRVFMTFYRMSSNRDPGATTNDCLSAKEHAVLLQDKKLLDLPKLLDLCAIYGHDNENLTRELVNNAIKEQPMLVELLPDTSYQFMRIVSTMHQRCSSSLETLATAGQGDKGCSRLYAELVEVVDFINDSIMTMDAFIDAYRGAAIYFSFPSEISNEIQELVTILGSLHDSLLPSIQHAFNLLSSRNEKLNFLNDNIIEKFELTLRLLSARLIKFGWKLLEICYLSDEFCGDTLLQSSRKIFPSQISDSFVRGEILLQTFRNIGHQTNVLEKNETWSTFLQGIDKNYYILSRVDSLRSSGWISMDDEQFIYLAQTIAPLSHGGSQMKEKSVISHSNGIKINDGDVIMESKISQIRDIFPEFGKGFLSACLNAYDQNPEEVIQRILEGTLHEDLLSLDTSLEELTSKTVSQDPNGKGKGILLETEPPSDKGKGFSHVQTSQAGGLSSSSAPLSKRDEDALPFVSSCGKFTRKSRNEQPVSQVLDFKGAKDSLKSAVLAAAEYEDEYDDSFDDLGLSISESVTEEVERSGDLSKSEVQKNDLRWNSRKTPQFYVKDGKNYSYKISGSVAVSDAHEAAALVQSQKELIHGLGRGGNIPYGVSLRPMVYDEEVSEEPEFAASGLRGRESSTSRGRGGKHSLNHGHGQEKTNPTNTVDQANMGTDGGRQLQPHGRGRGRGGNHHRKDRAMKKHFAGLTGY